MIGGGQARLYRRLALLVKVSALAIIATSGAYEYHFGGALLPTLGGADGVLSLNFENGRRLAISLGRPFEKGLDATGDGGRQDSTGRSSSNPPVATRVPTTANPPRASVLAAAAGERHETERRYAFCSLGRDWAADGGGVRRASLRAGLETEVDAYGLKDATLVVSVGETSNYVLPLLSSIKAQGAVAGFRVASSRDGTDTVAWLPNTVDAVPPGAGDFVMGVAHDAIDLLEVGHGSYTGELTPWYHTLNAGMRSEIIGGLACDASAGAATMEGTTDPRRLMMERNIYVSDGHSRLFGFAVAGHKPDRRVGHEVRLQQPGVVEINADLAADLPALGTTSQAVTTTGWNIERARYGSTRAVSVDLVVNGTVAATKSVVADGTRQSVRFAVPIERSSWVALRLMGAGHSNPIYVLVDNKPVRASRTSIEWSQRALVQAFEHGRRTWSAADAPIAAAAFNYAYALYGGLLRDTASP